MVPELPIPSKRNWYRTPAILLNLAKPISPTSVASSTSGSGGLGSNGTSIHDAQSQECGLMDCEVTTKYETSLEKRT